MWEWFMENSYLVILILMFFVALLLPHTGLVEYGKKLRKEEEKHKLDKK